MGPSRLPRTLDDLPLWAFVILLAVVIAALYFALDALRAVTPAPP